MSAVNVVLNETKAPLVTGEELPPRTAPGDRNTHAWLAYVAAVAAVCIMVGVYWDISWHMSVGRDTFWTPAHLLIQSGGLIAGLSSGFVVLRTTFGGGEAERAASVNFWGF